MKWIFTTTAKIVLLHKRVSGEWWPSLLALSLVLLLRFESLILLLEESNLLLELLDLFLMAIEEAALVLLRILLQGLGLALRHQKALLMHQGMLNTWERGETRRVDLLESLDEDLRASEVSLQTVHLLLNRCLLFLHCGQCLVAQLHLLLQTINLALSLVILSESV